MSTQYQLEMEKKACENQIKLAEALDRLEANPDFQLVIQSEYLVHEAVRNTHLLGDMAVSHNPVLKEQTIRQLYGIASFNAFLDSIHARGRAAISSKQGIEDELSGEEV